MAGKRTPEEIQRILNQPNPLVLTGPIRVWLGVLGVTGVVGSAVAAANIGKPPRIDAQGYVRTTRFERLPLPLQWAGAVCLFGIALGILLVALRDAVRRPTLSFDDEGMVNGYALTLKPVSIKWGDVVRIDEALKKDKRKKGGIVVFYRNPANNQQKRHIMSNLWGLKISQNDMYAIVMDRYRRWHERQAPANPAQAQQAPQPAQHFQAQPHQGAFPAASFSDLPQGQGPSQQMPYPTATFSGPSQQEAYPAGHFPGPNQQGAYPPASFSGQPQWPSPAEGHEQATQTAR